MYEAQLHIDSRLPGTNGRSFGQPQIERRLSMKKSILHAMIITFALTVIIIPITTSAQTPYPNKPIQLIIPFPPGGTSDIVGRILADALSKELGQPIIVENKAGAGGSVGTRLLAQAPSDGYTLLVGTTSTHGTNSAVYKSLPYDAEKDFTPITKLISAPAVIAVHPSFPAKNYPDFLKVLQESPDTYSYASSGTGGANHMGMEYFKSLTGVKILHVPYRGAGPAINDVIAGQVPIIWDTLASSIGHIKSGKMIAIAIAFKNRSPEIPEIPTFAEFGLKDYDPDLWNGLLAPANLPEPILQKLHAATVKAINKPETKAKYDNLGIVVVGNTPAQFGEEIRADVAKWKKVAQFSNVSLD
jgi:tripartite-type tricarboxylate transporter receptor subunit TctC